MATKDLEWTVFRNGFFMDYWGMPKVKSHMQPVVFAIDVANDMAAIPGDGNATVELVHTSDVGKFVAASLELDKWDRVSYVIGDRVTWNEFLKLAEEAKGESYASTRGMSLSWGETLTRIQAPSSRWSMTVSRSWRKVK
jgi:nucleoside-diphosphate-sugar epimerase